MSRMDRNLWRGIVLLSWGIFWEDLRLRLTKSRKEAKKLGLSGRIFTDMLVLNKTGQVENTITMISERDDNFSFTPRIFGLNEKHAIIGGFDRNDLILADIPLR